MGTAQKTSYSELVLVGAADGDALVSSLERLARFLAQAPDASLRDVAYTAACAYRDHAEKRAAIAFVVSSAAELKLRVDSALLRLRQGTERIRDKSGTYFFRNPPLGGDAPSGKLAFLFPGAGSFYPDMLRDLAIAFPPCRASFDELEEALAGSGRFSPSSFIFPPAPYYRRDADVFSGGAYAQAMVSTYSANAALFNMFSRLGVTPDGVLGFSGGDLNALAAAGHFGKFARPERLRFLREMYTVVDAAVSHAGLPKCVMAAVVATHPEGVEAALGKFSAEDVTPFFVISSHQRMLAVRSEAFGDVQAALTAAGAKVMRLDVDRPFNTPWCERILPMFRKFSGHWISSRGAMPVWCCATGEPLPEKPRHVRNVSAELWAQPVRLGETIRNMYEAGYRVFVEVGPRGVATSTVTDVLRGRSYVASVSNAVHRSGLLQFQHAAGLLAALGAALDPRALFEHHRCRLLDFDVPMALEVKADAEMPLLREFPALALLSADAPLAADKAPGARRANKAQDRAAARAARERRRRQFDFGATLPMISEMDVVDEEPGVSVEISTVLSFQEAPFLADAAIGTTQISFAEQDLRGFTLLPLAAGVEIMAELSQLLAPKRSVVAIDDVQRRRMVAFADGKLKLFVRAERVASGDPARAAFRVQLRDDAPDSAWTWPALEATVCLAAEPPAAASAETPPLPRPRSVHWTESDIYPGRLSAGERLRHIRRADLWSDVGLDYEVVVPPAAGAVTHTRFPVWVVSPQLLSAVTDGYSLWRSHERFPGAFSFAFRIRRIALYALSLPEGMRLKCYLRLTGVSPNSHICDITVTDGNGNLVLALYGYEELTERVPVAYRRLVLQPPLAFLTETLDPAVLGAPTVPVATAAVTEVPYAIFTRNEEIWLKTISQIVLCKSERRDFAVMSGSVNRRVEWLFGRIAAKEAVRRFLERHCQARWADADIEIWADDSGKPHAIGKWNDTLQIRLDLAIAHTVQFVTAVVAVQSRVGVDVEAMDRDLSEEFTRGVFTPEEFALAAGATNPQAAMIRFWCAKESVSKALGTGIRYAPKEMTIRAFRPETGEMEILLTGAWAENFPRCQAHPLTVSSAVVRGHVVATCLMPLSLFD